MTKVGLLTSLLLAFGVVDASAQSSPSASAHDRPRIVIEGSAGWAGFGDERLIRHTVVGIGGRLALSPRVSVGPELQFMMGPGDDRDLIVTGNVVVDLLAATAARPRRTTPYLVVGGGLFRHADRFAGRTFSSTEGAYTAGAGVRRWIGDRVFVAVDGRIGWEPHVRLAATIGRALR